MNIFVTGATKVLGQPVVRMLVKAGHNVYALSRSGGNDAIIRELGAEPVSVDLFDAAALAKALRQIRAEAVVHLATKIPPTARMGKAASWQENDHIRRDGMRALVEAALASDVHTVVYPSFYYVYPDSGERWIDAASTPVQSHVTQQATIDAEAEVARFASDGGGRRGISLRMGNLYGPGVPSALEQLQMARKGMAMLPGPGDAYLSYIWLEDAARAIVVALSEAPSGVYDIVDDEPVTRDEFAAALARSVGKKRLFRVPNGLIKMLSGVSADLITRSQRVSNQRFRQATSWQPTVSTVKQGWSLIADPSMATA